MKYTRLLLGATIILVALWVIIGEQMSGASGDAVLNAQVVTLRSPTAGNLAMSQRPLGAQIAKGEVLASVSDPLVDRVRLDDLTMDAAINAATLAGIEAEGAALARQRDGADTPPQTAALEGRIAALSARQSEAEARGAALAERLSREKLRVNSFTGGEILAPVDGQLWEILEADGVTVQRGDPILRLVDCGSVFVTLSVSERVYNSLHLGEAASFRLEGRSKTYDATVSRLAGSGAAAIYRNLAVAPGPRHLERFDVALLVGNLAEAGADGCLIGKTGRVFFDRRPLDWLRGLFG